MSEIIYDRTDELLEFAVGKIGIGTFRDDAKAIGLVDGERIIAACVFDTFSACDVNIHIASDGSRRWFSKAFGVATMAYPFIQLGMRRITGLVPAKNHDALQFDLKFGFKIEGYLDHALPDDDIIVLGLLRENCRWLPQNYRGA